MTAYFSLTPKLPLPTATTESRHDPNSRCYKGKVDGILPMFVLAFPPCQAFPCPVLFWPGDDAAAVCARACACATANEIDCAITCLPAAFTMASLWRALCTLYRSTGSPTSLQRWYKSSPCWAGTSSSLPASTMCMPGGFSLNFWAITPRFFQLSS